MRVCIDRRDQRRVDQRRRAILVELELAARAADHGRDLDQRAVVGRHRRRRAAPRDRAVDQVAEPARARLLGRRGRGVGIRDLVFDLVAVSGHGVLSMRSP
jgi:hypothetical protein